MEFEQGSQAETDPELIYLIGTIAARWATLDISLVTALAFLLAKNPRLSNERGFQLAHTIYFSIPNQRARLDVITNLARDNLPIPIGERDIF